MEDLYYDQNGRIYNCNLSAYHIPTALDIPREIRVDFVEAGYMYGPFGAKGLGEPSIVCVAPSIANAVAHALSSIGSSKGLNRIPLTPDYVYHVIKGLMK